MSTINAETAVRERYAAGARAAEAKLCCPVDYDPQYLKVIPQAVIERDYGCGDPSQHVHVIRHHHPRPQIMVRAILRMKHFRDDFRDS